MDLVRRAFPARGISRRMAPQAEDASFCYDAFDLMPRHYSGRLTGMKAPGLTDLYSIPFDEQVQGFGVVERGGIAPPLFFEETFLRDFLGPAWHTDAPGQDYSVENGLLKCWHAASTVTRHFAPRKVLIEPTVHQVVRVRVLLNSIKPDEGQVFGATHELRLMLCMGGPTSTSGGFGPPFDPVSGSLRVDFDFTSWPAITVRYWHAQSDGIWDQDTDTAPNDTLDATEMLLGDEVEFSFELLRRSMNGSVADFTDVRALIGEWQSPKKTFGPMTITQFSRWPVFAITARDKPIELTKFEFEGQYRSPVDTPRKQSVFVGRPGSWVHLDDEQVEAESGYPWPTEFLAPPGSSDGRASPVAQWRSICFVPPTSAEPLAGPAWVSLQKTASGEPLWWFTPPSSWQPIDPQLPTKTTIFIEGRHTTRGIAPGAYGWGYGPVPGGTGDKVKLRDYPWNSEHSPARVRAWILPAMHVVFLDGDTPALVNFADVAHYPASPPPGRIMQVWRDRLVIAGCSIAPAQWFMSRQANPFDWHYFADPDDPGRAVSGTLAHGGEVPDPITAIAPHSDDFLVIWTISQTWVMRGDPAAGGRLDNISRGIGCISDLAWTKTSDGTIVWVGRGGIYAMLPGSGQYPVLLSENLPAHFQYLHTLFRRVHLVWDEYYYGVWIYLVPASGPGETWWLDWHRRGFWRISSPAEPVRGAATFPQAPDNISPAVVFTDRVQARRRIDSAGNGYLGAGGTRLTFMPIALGESSGRQGLLNRLRVERQDESLAVRWYVATDGSATVAAERAATPGMEDRVGVTSFESRPWALVRARGNWLGLRLNDIDDLNEVVLEVQHPATQRTDRAAESPGGTGSGG